jgi:hypothetical protein
MTEEYLTIEELSARLKIKPKTIENKMASGDLPEGRALFQPEGLGRTFQMERRCCLVGGTREAARGTVC